uniref:CWH43-like N-terminal domain-containing protein n=1 Tax=Astatotilapia calliptera TaxID=8154 RepID=A0AAX7U7W2_ASTCA
MVNFSLWALLPPIYSVCTAAGLLMVYFIAVYNKNITPLGSQYSIAGNFPPASCVFSEVMNLAAFVGFFIAVFRYLQLKGKIDKPWLNISSLVVFSISSFGMTIVGNFQVFTETNIHNVGAILVFGLGTLSCWLQSYITLRVNLKNEGKMAAIARFLLSGSITLCMILYFSLMSQRLHMHASQCQWALVMMLLIFISTFAIEFRHSSFSILCTDRPGYPFHHSETSEGPM